MTNFDIFNHDILSSANAFNLDFDKVLSFGGKRVKCGLPFYCSGSLILQTPLDYEVRREWILHVTASDGSNVSIIL